MLHPATITWRPGFNDNDFTGWLVTIGYVVTVLACFRAARRVRADAVSASDYSGVWRGIGIVLLLLGINQQLDLQVLIIQAGRDVAKLGGWYEHRRSVQKVFLGVFALAILAGTVFAAWRWRSFFCRHRLVTAGLVLLLGWLLFRAAVIDHVGARNATSRRLDVYREYLELCALTLVGVGAWRSRRTR